MPFKYNADGPLDLYFQNESPGNDNEANWLPAPKARFNLTMRLYSPQPDALTGKWNPPPVKKVEAVLQPSTQRSGARSCDRWRLKRAPAAIPMPKRERQANVDYFRTRPESYRGIANP
jgi:hypothetical protein